jgi:predicted nucleic acid-binding Zn ribbon protein
MFESLAACVSGPAWKPKARLSVAELKKYLAARGRAPRIKERMMTQYWQLDAEPLESARYWKDAEAWIRKR